MRREKIKISIKNLSFILIGGVILIVVIYVVALIYFTWPIDELSLNKSGVFGDKVENTFFQMMSLHSEILKGIDLQQGANTMTGRDAFKVMQNTMLNGKTMQLLSSNDLEKINEGYLSIYQSYQNELGHYFRYLYNIMKFIDRSPMEDKRFYSNLLRAQLSNYELVLLFYNCLSVYGRDKFKLLVEEYGLLKNMPKQLIFNFSGQEGFYKKSAYKGS